ncbi:MAG: toll/interleukin-1 receptor domain-containing protein [Gammaproteobacteria bacterium]|nr:toll/interleukin-1 receptor domain-containing protein [Gammaproteobacteria bacterium]MXW45975.1 toll/interleukin-1 receptor domain-containing protein [Gammaproteobacteria bacterium]MYD02462.1 toll/interleukin-1 receptor domain-containing protein [Gammaproteobacteria bacterium]MYI25948.1 toll/interleukin-1 receptor domain-containing protein [Gammaproteobacteria bacterium]
MPNEVFLSHSSVDRAFVIKLADALRIHGIPVWYSETDIRGAQQWHDEIGAALRRCDWLVLVLSPDAVASKWVKRELLFSLGQDRFNERIAPIIHRACDHDELSWTLSQMQMIDFENDFDEGCRNLLRVWGIGYRMLAPGES